MANLVETIQKTPGILRSARAIWTARPVNMGADNPNFTEEFKALRSQILTTHIRAQRSVAMDMRDRNATVIKVAGGEYLALINGEIEYGKRKKGQLWGSEAALERTGLVDRGVYLYESRGSIRQAILSGEVIEAWRFRHPSPNFEVYKFTGRDSQYLDGFAIFISQLSRSRSKPHQYSEKPLFYAVNEPGRRILGQST